MPGVESIAGDGLSGNCHGCGSVFGCGSREVLGCGCRAIFEPRMNTDFHGWRLVFVIVKRSVAPLAPGMGEEPGVRGKVSPPEPCPGCFVVARALARALRCRVSSQCCFFHHRGHRGHRGAAAVIVSFQLSLLPSLWHGCPCPPHPRPLSPVSRGRGEDFVFFVIVNSAWLPSPLEGALVSTQIGISR